MSRPKKKHYTVDENNVKHIPCACCGKVCNEKDFLLDRSISYTYRDDLKIYVGLCKHCYENIHTKKFIALVEVENSKARKRKQDNIIRTGNIVWIREIKARVVFVQDDFKTINFIPQKVMNFFVKPEKQLEYVEELNKSTRE